MSIADGRQDIKSIIGNERFFVVPNYQRSYAWKEKQLNDFLDDFSHIENYKKYYYGTILLQECISLDDTYQIVDGQQRLTTLIIFMYCLINRLKEHGLVEKANELYRKYIKYETNYILKLQDQDDGFFKTYILNENINSIKRTPAQENLFFAKTLFTNFLKNTNADECQDILIRLQCANCLVYKISDSKEAAMIFETTNDRGKILTNLEKTKSYLMYKVSTTLENAQSLLDTIQQGFNDVYLTFESLKELPKFYVDENSIQQYMFIAYENWKNEKKDGKSYKAYQNYMNELKTKINGFVKLINNSTDKEQHIISFNDYIERYIRNLCESFNAIKEMYSSNSSFCSLLSLGRMASIYPILIKSYSIDKTNNKVNFKELCKWCEIFCFRCLTILKYLSNKYQDKWFHLAKDFNGDFDKLIFEIKNMIMQLGDNEKFLKRLSEPNFFREYYSQERLYFFWSYENYLREARGYQSLTYDDLWETDTKKKLTIEHIVAQNDEKDKNRILKDEKYLKVGQRKYFDKEYLHAIGNLTIDPNSANASKGKKEVEEKNSDYFVKAPLMCQNELDNFMINKKWTIESIEKRKEKLLIFAKKTWCFNFTNVDQIIIDDTIDEVNINE